MYLNIAPGQDWNAPGLGTLWDWEYSGTGNLGMLRNWEDSGEGPVEETSLRTGPQLY